MKKIKLKKKKLILLGILLFIFSVGFLVIGFSFYYLSSVNDDSSIKEIEIPEGSSFYDIASILKDNNLIKSEKFFILYIKIKSVDNIYAASYSLSSNMDLKEIVNELEKGGHNVSDISITFNEGINMRKVATIISENTNNSYDDVMNTLNDSAYLDSLIKDYWFISDDIKNKKIYYSLEGYLYPDTYFINKDSSVEEIFKVLLDKMNEILTPYKKQIEKNDLSIHEILTIASVTQSEGVNADDFNNIASVFLNRIDSGMALGSCVTSYYGVKKEMTEELLQKDIDNSNAYNTRGDNPVLVPVGPISMPGKDAIKAVVEPVETNYYYFVSDKNHKLYFTKNYNEHIAMQEKLQKEGLWLEW